MSMTQLTTISPLANQLDNAKYLVEIYLTQSRLAGKHVRIEAHTKGDDTILILEEFLDKDTYNTHAKAEHTTLFHEAIRKLVREPEGLSTTTLQPFAREKTSLAPVRAMDHVGITVPNVEEAAAFFERAFGAIPVYDVIPKGSEPLGGPDAEAELGLEEGSCITHMRLMRFGQGPCIELFQIDSPDQRKVARLQDFGLTHFGVYVDNLTASIEAFKAAGGTLLRGPHGLAGIEQSPNNQGIYVKTPWGMLIELMTYPDGIDYDEHVRIPRWTPGL